MKNKFIIIILILIPAEGLYSNNFSEKEDSVINKIRNIYYAGVEEEKYIDSLNIIIAENYGADTSSYSSLILAYKAGMTALKSKHAFWPFTKMNYLNESMSIFERAVKKDPDNLEIRFMRYSILYYVPGILGYNAEEENDLRTVLRLLLQKNNYSIDENIKSGMAEFLINSGELNDEQINRLKNNFVFAVEDE